MARSRTTSTSTPVDAGDGGSVDLPFAGSAPSRDRILTTLEDSPRPLGVLELAQRVGLHPNTVRFHLDRLASAGAVQRHVEKRSQPGRPRLSYTASAARDPADVRSYRLLAEILARHLSSAGPSEEVALAAGDAWGRSLAQAPRVGSRTSEEDALTALLRTLRVIGFAPEFVAEGREVLLRHCPFLEVAQAHRDVVCAVHLGLMRGMLDGMAAPLAADELRPFVQPSLCVALLRDRAVAL